MSTSVNSANVKSLVDKSLSDESVASNADITARTGRAFRKLQWRRRHLAPLDIDLAAAEHYLYARFLAGSSGDPMVRYAPALYGLKKRALFAFGLEQAMATTSNPVLPPDDEVERWGSLGARDGLADYCAVHGVAPTNYGEAARALAEQAFHYR